jgi:hypothetical protein
MDMESVIKKIICIILKENEFTHTNSTPLLSLSHSMVLYFQKLAAFARDFANNSGRTFINLHDIVFLFAHLDISLSMPIKQETIIHLEIEREEKETETETAIHRVFKGEEVEPLPSHIPSYMPPYPPKHSFRQSAIVQKREYDPVKIRELCSTQTRELQTSLKMLVKKCEKTEINVVDRLREVEKIEHLPKEERREKMGFSKEKAEYLWNSFPSVSYEFQSVEN